MRHYLSTLHARTPSHKKRFAFLVSGGFTLSLFFIWSLVRFSPFSEPVEVAQNTDGVIELVPTSGTAKEISPFENLQTGVAASFEAVRNGFNEAKGNIKTVNINDEYQKVKTDTLNQSDSNTTVSGTIYGN
jgi:hypothetical protein